MLDTASAQIANCLDHLPFQNGGSVVRLRDFVEGMAAPLRLHGHEVRLAYDGQSDLEEAHAFRPDVIFLDSDLPKLGGCDVARRLRLEPAMRDRTLVAMTGYDQEEDRQRTLEAGFQLHLVKPVDFNKVDELLPSLSDSCSLDILST